jgi:hypothetical protein
LLSYHIVWVRQLDWPDTCRIPAGYLPVRILRTATGSSVDASESVEREALKPMADFGHAGGHRASEDEKILTECGERVFKGLSVHEGVR